jgi:hypothetical protein
MLDTPPAQPPTPEEWQQRTEALFERVIRIGQMAFGEIAQPPPPFVDAAPPPSANAEGAGAAPAPKSTLIKNLPERLDLEQARARLPFMLRLPAWIPEGFVRQDEISVAGAGFGSVSAASPGQPADVPDPFQFPLTVHAMWRHSDGRGLRLRVTRWPDEHLMTMKGGITPVPLGAVRAVTVQGAPAALIERWFSLLLPSGETAVSDDPELRWDGDGLQYSLGAFQWPRAGEVLVKIAESLAAGG